MKKFLSIIALVIAITTAFAFSASAATLYDEATDGRGKVVETPVGYQDFTVTFKVAMSNPIDEGQDGYTSQFLMIYLSETPEFAADDAKFNLREFRLISRHIQPTADGQSLGIVDFGGKTFKNDGAMTFELTLKNGVLTLTNKDAAASGLFAITFPDGSFAADKPMYLVFDNHGSQGVSVSDFTVVATDYTAPGDDPAVQTGYALVPVVALGAVAAAVLVIGKKKR
ncbi:MAG: hypothetical protein J5563_05195 [Clostridia bacterium]|nr:hypothetical protein [Clostridia bacterium]